LHIFDSFIRNIGFRIKTGIFFNFQNYLIVAIQETTLENFFVLHFWTSTNEFPPLDF